jgi:hypothetical protein
MGKAKTLRAPWLSRKLLCALMDKVMLSTRKSSPTVSVPLGTCSVSALQKFCTVQERKIGSTQNPFAALAVDLVWGATPLGGGRSMGVILHTSVRATMMQFRILHGQLSCHDPSSRSFRIGFKRRHFLSAHHGWQRAHSEQQWPYRV